MTGEIVAVKKPVRNDSEAQARFVREVEVQRKLDHPNVMPILDFSLDGGLWYSMPHARHNLTGAIKLNGSVHEHQLPAIIRQVGNGLAHAHAQGCIHRDVNPNNIFELEDDGVSRWVIGDWGLVRRTEGEASPRLTRRGRPLGTGGFIAPEVELDARRADAAADVYSLGRVAHYALTGSWPRDSFPMPSAGRLWGEFVVRCTAKHGTRPDTVSAALRLVRTIESEIRAMQDRAELLICPRCQELMPGARCDHCGRFWD